MLQGCYPRGGNQLRCTHGYYSKRSLVEVTSSEETISTQLMVADLQPADWIMSETGRRKSCRSKLRDSREHIDTNCKNVGDQ